MATSHGFSASAVFLTQAENEPALRVMSI